MIDVASLVRKAREHDEKATKGPWFICDGEDCGDPTCTGIYNSEGVGVFAETVEIDEHQARRNAEFATWARQGVPALCDALEERERDAAEYLSYLRNIYEAIYGEAAWTPSALSIYNETLNALEGLRQRARGGDGK